MIEPLALLLAALLGSDMAGWKRPDLAILRGPGAGPVKLEPTPVFRVDDQSVSTWRNGTRTTLEPAPLAIAASWFVSGRPVVTRCVKLNNPWCIKQARWSGELGGDDESHTAFATTEFGADAAANLLRTYYVTLGRRTALDIVRRWAPAECRIGSGSGLSVMLAVGGLSNTLRARFLASQGRTGTAQPRRVQAGKPPRTRVSSVPLAPLPTYRGVDIAAGMGVRPGRPEVERPAARTPPVVRSSAPPPPVRYASARAPAPVASGCGSEEGRIRYYGSAIAKALGVSPDDDLKLFDEVGQPTANLLPVMVAMSAIELGYLHAGPELVERAIDRLRIKLALAANPAPSPELSGETRASPIPPRRPAD